jgi:hypothetical protein
VKSILFIFWRGIGLFQFFLTVEENAGMPEIYRFVVDYEYQEKKKEIYLKYTVFENYIPVPVMHWISQNILCL